MRRRSGRTLEINLRPLDHLVDPNGASTKTDGDPKPGGGSLSRYRRVYPEDLLSDGKGLTDRTTGTTGAPSRQGPESDPPGPQVPPELHV